VQRRGCGAFEQDLTRVVEDDTNDVPRAMWKLLLSQMQVM